MGFYPIVVELGGRPCLVVGGGPVATRKVEGLLEAGASVTVVGPALTDRLAALVREERVRHVPRRWRPEDLAGQALVVVATDDRALTAAVARAARAHGVWVNAADDLADSDFILPAVLRRGPLTVAVTTGGTSPALAAAVRDRLAEVVTEDHGVVAGVAADVRRELRGHGVAPDGARWRRALAAVLGESGKAAPLAADGGREQVRQRLLERLGPDARSARR